MHYHALSLKLACLLGSHSCTVMYRYALLRPNSLQNCCKIAFLLQTAVNPLPGLFPRKPLNSLIDFPLILFSLLLFFTHKILLFAQFYLLINKKERILPIYKQTKNCYTGDSSLRCPHRYRTVIKLTGFLRKYHYHGYASSLYVTATLFAKSSRSIP